MQSIRRSLWFNTLLLIGTLVMLLCSGCTSFDRLVNDTKSRDDDYEGVSTPYPQEYTVIGVLANTRSIWIDTTDAKSVALFIKDNDWEKVEHLSMVSDAILPFYIRNGMEIRFFNVGLGTEYKAIITR